MPVGIVNKTVGWTIEEWWLESWQEEEFFFLFYIYNILLDQFWDSLSFLFSGYWGFFLVVNVAEARSCSRHVMPLRVSGALCSFPVSLLGVHN